MQAKGRARANRALDHLKGRIAEALVEGMFRRAGYAVSRVGRESQVPRLLKTGKDEFLPDFMLRKAVERPGSDRPLHQLIPIEVKYRHDVARFLRDRAKDFFESASRWPDLCLILSDHPQEGRSCFQVLLGADEAAPTTTDLEQVAVLDIYRSTVAEYSELTTKLFALLSESRAAQTVRVG